MRVDGTMHPFWSTWWCPTDGGCDCGGCPAMLAGSPCPSWLTGLSTDFFPPALAFGSFVEFEVSPDLEAGALSSAPDCSGGWVDLFTAGPLDGYCPSTSAAEVLS